MVHRTDDLWEDHGVTAVVIVVIVIVIVVMVVVVLVVVEVVAWSTAQMISGRAME